MFDSSHWPVLALIAFASGCDGKGDDSSAGDADADADADTDSDTDSDTDGDTDADTDSDTDADTDSDTDTDTDTDVDSCGDGKVNGKDECDDGGESAACDVDCTFATCGDGTVNPTAGETCEPVSTEPWDACATCSAEGAGLDGTFGTKWESLTYPTTKNHVGGLQSFHYSGAPYIFDFTVNGRYDIAKDTWTAVGVAPPFGTGSNWCNGAVDGESIWLPRSGVMYKFDQAKMTWSKLKGSIPDGSYYSTAAVFDREGYIWYMAEPGLVQYDTAAGTATTFKHSGFEPSETRVAYDPIGHRVAFAGFGNDRFQIYDIAAGTFSVGAASPDGQISDNTCGDNSGGIYTGGGSYQWMYRYDFASDTWTVLPDLPSTHDNNSSCVVSQDGYLYYPTQNTNEFFRLPLGVK